ncbi:MAG: endonuclease/exonuclease/phosphatase family protein, partial [Acidobacteria bacterium]|nr:endonuclease/exonuclease/phosphatase family protein [Acidobacteriota bacterium]
LGRTDRGMTFTHATGANFWFFATLPILGQNFKIKQGYCMVDVDINSKRFRFISTHLDPEIALDNQLQIWQILIGPANTRMNDIFVGDFNSPAAGGSRFVAYQNALAAGFLDGWSTVNPTDPGNTVGHASNLLDPPPVNFTQRIDYTLYKGNILPTSSVLFGLDPAQRTPSGLWPSDHAGVITTFLVQ